MSAQIGLFCDSQSSYVQACLNSGAKVASFRQGIVGMVLCPDCLSEADLDSVWDKEKLIGFTCQCGRKFLKGEEMVLSFGK